MGESCCLGCRHYDARPGLARDLDEWYGICRWEPGPVPIVMLGHDVVRDSKSVSSRMISKRGLEARPDLWAYCPTREPRAAAPPARSSPGAEEP